MASRRSLPRPLAHVASLSLVTLIAAVILLLAPGPAGAVPPTLDSVGQENGYLTASWTLAPGTSSSDLVVAPTDTPSSTFGLEDLRWWFDADTGMLDRTATSFKSPYAFDAGTWYVRVAAEDGSEFPTKEWSNILSLTILPVCADGIDNDVDGKTDHPADPGCSAPGDNDETDPPLPPGPSTVTPPTLVSATQSGGRLTATWTLAPGTVSSAIVVSGENVPDDFHGLFGVPGYSWDTTMGTLQPSATSFTSPNPLDARTWYVRVAANDGSGPFATNAWSDVLSFTVKPICSDGVDNDGDGKTDYPGDPGCLTADESDEADPPAAPQPKGPASVAVAVRRVDGIGRVRRRGIRVGVACPRACTATSRILLGTRVLGRRSKTLRSSGYAAYPVKLSTVGRRRIAGAKSAKVRVVTKVVRAGGASMGKFTRRVRLARATPPNRAPAFPSSIRDEQQTRFVYDDDGRLYTGYTAITVKSPATDPDGDPLTYRWSGASDLKAKGPSVVWERPVNLGRLGSGTLRLTVSDGRGASDSVPFPVG
jgi:hypothetical protein